MEPPLNGMTGDFLLHEAVVIHAPIDRCFQLSCSVALVREELGMEAVCGTSTGQVVRGDIIRWEGWQLGWKHFHVSHISSYDRPVFLQDTMLDGRFRFFRHDHHLREAQEGTVLEDDLYFSLPAGPLGRLVGKHLMVPHVRKLMKSRFARIKRIAESAAWRRYLDPEAPGRGLANSIE